MRTEPFSLHFPDSIKSAAQRPGRERPWGHDLGAGATMRLRRLPRGACISSQVWREVTIGLITSVAPGSRSHNAADGRLRCEVSLLGRPSRFLFMCPL